MTTQSFTAIFGTITQIAIMLSGLGLIVGGSFPSVRRLAWRIFFLGIFLAIVGSIGYQWLPPSLRIEG
jgi:hypothetical protein